MVHYLRTGSEAKIELTPQTYFAKSGRFRLSQIFGVLYKRHVELYHYFSILPPRFGCIVLLQACPTLARVTAAFVIRCAVFHEKIMKCSNSSSSICESERPQHLLMNVCVVCDANTVMR